MALSENTRGALYMMGSMTAFTLNDACMKLVSGQLPLFQAVALRSFPVILFLGFMAWRGGVFRTPIERRDKILIAVRTAVELAAAYFFISALFHLPIADVTAILQALPLTVTLAGAMFLGEPVGWRRLLAIVVGFSGVLLIVQPPFLFGEGTGFSIYSIYVLLAEIEREYSDADLGDDEDEPFDFNFDAEEDYSEPDSKLFSSPKITNQVFQRLFRITANKLHPDRELDPALRKVKQGLMSDLLTARKKSDVMTILALYQEHVDGQETF